MKLNLSKILNVDKKKKLKKFKIIFQKGSSKEI